MPSSQGSRTGSRLVKTAAGLLCLIALPILGEHPDLKLTPVEDTVSTDSGGQSGINTGPFASVCEPATMGSPFVTMDSWIYPTMFRLYGPKFVDHVFLGMRPWTRSSINRMLEGIAAKLEVADPGPERDQAEEIYESLAHELRFDITEPCLAREGKRENRISLHRGTRYQWNNTARQFPSRLHHHQ